MKKYNNARFWVIIGIIIAFTLYAVGFYAYFMKQDYVDKAKPFSIPVERGNILDRNGKILATQTFLYDIYIKPPAIDDHNARNAAITKIAIELAPIVSMDVYEIINSIYQAKGEFIIKKQVPWSIREQLQKIQQIESIADYVRAVAVPARDYPETFHASQIIGFRGVEDIGEGIEYALDNYLAEGCTVMLTIDIHVQQILEKSAASVRNRTNAESVLFLAADPRSGDILGSAVIPGFDPNNFTKSDPATFHHIAADKAYEPGSVFKIFSIAALLDSGVISEHSEFTCNGSYERVFSNGQRLRVLCANSTAHGRVRPREIITLSCNIGSALAADRLHNQTFYDLLLTFGFNNVTGAWVNGATLESSAGNRLLLETPGKLLPPDTWTVHTKPNVAFGQGISVSALQMMQALSAIANDGVLVPLKIVSQIIAPDGKNMQNDYNKRPGYQVIRPETAQKMLSYMRDTVREGTGQLASIRDIPIAVKTGTAQMIEKDPITGQERYSETDFITSCIALLPANTPSLALYVIIIKPRGETLGGRIAAPAIRETADELINYFRIPRQRNYRWEHTGNITLPEITVPAIGSTIGDYYGLSKRDLLPLLSQNNIRVEIFGEGWVTNQSPPPGTAVTPGMVLELVLE